MLNKSERLDRIGLVIIEQAYQFTGLVPVPRHPGIVVHWMGPGRFTEDSRNPGTVVQGIHRAEGYAGIGYHGIVTQDGKYRTGRPYLHRGAHCAAAGVVDKNDHFGLLWYGGAGTDKAAADVPTAAALESLARAIAWVCVDQGLACNRQTVRAHREYLSTACCGTLYPLLDQVVARAAAIIKGLDAPQAPPAAAPAGGNVTTPTAPALPTCRVVIAGQVTEGVLINSRVHVPLSDPALQALLTQYGYELSWDPNTRTAEVKAP